MKFGDAEKKVDKKLEKQYKDKVDRVKKYRKEVSRRASMANKRIKRLEAKGMNTPALEKWREGGGEYFSIRGKSYNQVQSEMARINEYLDSATSSITGAKKVLNEVIDNTGLEIEWSDWNEAQDQVTKFFQISSQVEQYLRTAEDRASAIGYQRIWEAVNSYVKETQIDLADSRHSVGKISHGIIKAQKVFDETATSELWDKYGSGLAKQTWLPKDKP